MARGRTSYWKKSKRKGTKSRRKVRYTKRKSTKKRSSATGRVFKSASAALAYLKKLAKAENFYKPRRRYRRSGFVSSFLNDYFGKSSSNYKRPREDDLEDDYSESDPKSSRME